MAMLDKEARDIIVRVQDKWALRLHDRLLGQNHSHLGKVQVEEVCPCGQEFYVLVRLPAVQ